MITHSTNTMKSIQKILAILIIYVLSGCSSDLKEPIKSENQSISSEKNISEGSSSSIETNEWIDSELEQSKTTDDRIKQAFDNSENDIQVLVRGEVIRILSDDVVGDKHQRFIVKLESGHTLLITHNIDIALRVPDTMLNSNVYVYGEYVWNTEGGLVHWTHKDPDGSHIDGYIKINGIVYQ
jgi:hypothetical protein